MKKKSFLLLVNIFTLIISCSPNVSNNTNPSPSPTISTSPSPTNTPTPKPSSTPTATPTPKKSSSPTPKPTVTPTPSPTPTPDDTPLVKKIILKSKQNYELLNNYSGTLEIYSKRNDLTQKDSPEITNSQSQYVFQSPRNQMFKVLKHNNTKMEGAKMVWKGGSTTKVKADGILGFVTLELNITDSKVTTNRGWSIDKMDHVAVLNRALDSKANLTLLGKTTANGRDAYLIKIENSLSGLDTLVTEEEISIDTKSYLIFSDSFYKDKDLVFQSKMSIQYINTSLPLDTFDI
jgi:hypothetical protein